jgi:hypothetical protein
VGEVDVFHLTGDGFLGPERELGPVGLEHLGEPDGSDDFDLFF